MVPMIESRNVPIEPDDDFEPAVARLQAMLLQYRCDWLFEALPEPERLPIKPRLLQLYWPLARVASDRTELDELFLEMNDDLLEEIGFQADYAIGERLRAAVEGGSNRPIYFTDLAEADPTGRITPRDVGKVVDMLGLKFKKNNKERGRRMIVSPYDEIGSKLAANGW